MFCPEKIVVDRWSLMVIRHDGADYTAEVPWRIRLNPLRYALTFFPGPRRWTINDGGRWARKFSNAMWWLYGARRAARRNPEFAARYPDLHRGFLLRVRG